MGYVQRRPNPRDRRSRLVFLTERGESVRPVTARHRRASRGALGGVDEPEELEKPRCFAC